MMQPSQQLRSAQAAILRKGLPISLGVLAAVPVVDAQQAPATTSGGLEEIIVTATKREESMQSIPISIQAIGTEKLEQLNVSQFDDYVKYLPSVSFQSAGPGFAQVYFRGVASGGDGNHSGSSPSVGIYLDEQPITTIQGALDVHMYDIARVEALAGPQGTLYGASSQAGTIRIITNKPEIGKFSAGYGVEGSVVSHGDVGYLLEGFVNLPINDQMAVRLVGWHRHDPGYIDNVKGGRKFPSQYCSDPEDSSTCVQLWGGTDTNEDVAKKNYNDADTTGLRAALKFDLNDNWTITPQLMAQTQKENGIYGYDPGIGKYEVLHMYPEWSDDQWVQAALTVEGKIGNWDLLYSGAYLTRDVDTRQDYADYAYWYDVYAGYGQYMYDNDGNLINPSQFIHGKDRYKRVTNELRLASPGDLPVKGVVGLFAQRSQHGIQQRYMVQDLTEDFWVTGWPDTLWLTEQLRVDKDMAAFGEITWDISDHWSVTGGIREFKTDNSLKGFFGFGRGFSSKTGEAACTINTPNGAAGPDFTGAVDRAPCKNVDKSTDETGNTLKANVTYKFDDTKLVYATYSEGFRPGGINRRATLPPYKADYLYNYEAGWKTTWANNTVRFNGAVFQEDWKDFQFSFLGANGLTEIKNAAQARIRGIEADLSWAVSDQFNLTTGASYLDSELTENYCGFTDDKGNPVTASNCPSIDPDTGDTVFNTPQAKKGTQLPVTPKFKGNVTGRYEFPMAGFNAYFQGAAVYVGKRRSDLRDFENSIVGDVGAYTLIDLSTGIGRDNWNLDLFINNAFDEDATLYRYAECAEAVCGAQTYNVNSTPRTIALKFSQKF